MKAPGMYAKPLPARVSPQVSGPAALHAYAVTVRNLTDAGISLSVTPDVDAALNLVDEIELTLDLPGQSRSCAIACIVRNRATVDDVVVYGCEYDWSSTLDPLGVVEDLLEYMLDD